VKNRYYFLGALLVFAILALIGSSIPAIQKVGTRYLVGATDYLLVYVDNPDVPEPDTTPPVVTLVGSATVNLTVGDAYTELGATATDNIDSNPPIRVFVDGASSGILITDVTLDTSVAATHSLVYKSTDSAGNVGSATRSVGLAARGGLGLTVGGGGGGGGGGGVSAPPTIKTNTPAKPSDLRGKGDLNGDGKVTIADFSLLAYWFKRTLTAQAIAAGVDLNGDGKVTLADFSILAYYWNK
jgi:hypothetical protein